MHGQTVSADRRNTRCCHRPSYSFIWSQSRRHRCCGDFCLRCAARLRHGCCRSTHLGPLSARGRLGRRNTDDSSVLARLRSCGRPEWSGVVDDGRELSHRHRPSRDPGISSSYGKISHCGFCGRHCPVLDHCGCTLAQRANKRLINPPIVSLRFFFLVSVRLRRDVSDLQRSPMQAGCAKLKVNGSPVRFGTSRWGSSGLSCAFCSRQRRKGKRILSMNSCSVH